MRAPVGPSVAAQPAQLLVVLWFVALSVAAVFLVFDSVALDYRLIAAGSLLPWIDFVWGPPWPLHSVFFPVVVMTLVMIVGWGRRLWQRRWLCLAIGLFMHLVLAATWTVQDAFWWPVFGAPQSSSLPRPSVGLAAFLEIVGLVVLVWLWRGLQLNRPAARSALIRTGRIDRRPPTG